MPPCMFQYDPSTDEDLKGGFSASMTKEAGHNIRTKLGPALKKAHRALPNTAVEPPTVIITGMVQYAFSGARAGKINIRLFEQSTQFPLFLGL